MEKNLCVIDDSVKISDSAVIEPFSVIKGNTIIGDNSYVGSFCHIENSVLKNNVRVENSFIIDSIIEDYAEIGPYSKITKNTTVGKNCVIGNYVEIKNSIIGENTKSKHHTYIGDATIGKNCNIGCGVIFANYNGVRKYRSNVGDNVFIGSNSVIISPCTIGDKCYICAGTNLTKDIESNSFVIAREREVIKPNYRDNYFEKLKNK